MYKILDIPNGRYILRFYINSSGALDMSDYWTNKREVSRYLKQHISGWRCSSPDFQRAINEFEIVKV